jgi:L-threonylcarbamoyladenylate synthase
VIVHISDLAMLDKLVEEIPGRVRRLMGAFWPGPLTLLLPRTKAVPDAVTAGRALVGVRMPAHPVALKVIRRAGVPIAAPSANMFGRISPTTAEHVLADLDGRIDAVLDASKTPMVIYRPGAVTADQIAAIGGAVEIFRRDGELEETPREAMPSPGVGLRHYAPRARLVLVEGPLAELAERLGAAVRSWPQERVGLMLPAEIASAIEEAVVFRWGSWAAPEEMARELYAGLRALDAEGCGVIVCPLPPGEGIGAAIRDRLLKAGNRE